MYREGLLPSGKPMQALVQEDILVDSTAFSCSSCHLRSGIGSVEGQVFTPPVDGNTLFRAVAEAPMGSQGKFSRESIQRAAAGFGRPAYTDISLATAIRGGVNPLGKSLNKTMPRYPLDDDDMAILLFYLKNLSTTVPPGVTNMNLHFATVVTDDVPAIDRQAVLGPLELMANVSKSGKASKMAKMTIAAGKDDPMAKGYRTLTLSQWILKGPSGSWKGQLEEYYKKDPVFALLGGISNSDWRLMHEFCESHKIPCILPLTDFPVLSETDWYTLYFSKGLYQEGEAAAKFLHRREAHIQGLSIVQVYRDNRQEQSLSKGFDEAWSELGYGKTVHRIVTAGEVVNADFWAQIVNHHKEAVFLLWLKPSDITFVSALSNMPHRPRVVFLSSSLLRQATYTLPDSIRKYAFITYPYRLPDDFERFKPSLTGWFSKTHLKDANPEIQVKMLTIFSLVPQAVFMMQGYFVRERFLEVIDMMQTMQTMDETASIAPLYPRFSFGPGQRYAVKGCYITQLTDGPTPKLVSVSDWVIH